MTTPARQHGAPWTTQIDRPLFRYPWEYGYEWRDDLALETDQRDRGKPVPAGPFLVAREPPEDWTAPDDDPPGIPLTKRDIRRARNILTLLKTDADSFANDSIEFVEAFDFLGLSEWLTTKDGRPRRGEPMSLWQAHADTMWLTAFLLEVSDSLARTGSHRDREDLLTYIDIDSEFILSDPKHPLALCQTPLLGVFVGDPEIGIHPPNRALCRMARQVVADVVSFHLLERIEPRIGPSDKPRLTIGPRSLLGALYLEVARDLTGRTENEFNCAWCGKPFAAKRRDAKSCSARCRSNLFYHRRIQSTR